MTKIRCPKCHRSGDLTTQGKWYVQCSDCDTRFLVHVIPQKQVKERTIACPHCGYQEIITIDGTITVNCPECSQQFSLSN